MASEWKWKIMDEEDNWEYFLDVEQVIEHLEALKSRHSGHAYIYENRGLYKVPLRRRIVFFFLTLKITPAEEVYEYHHVNLGWCGDFGHVIFCEDELVQYVAKGNRSLTKVPTEEERLTLGFGDLIDLDECLEKETAFRAAYEYLRTLKRPTWLVY